MRPGGILALIGDQDVARLAADAECALGPRCDVPVTGVAVGDAEAEIVRHAATSASSTTSLPTSTSIAASFLRAMVTISARMPILVICARMLNNAGPWRRQAAACRSSGLCVSLA